MTEKNLINRTVKPGADYVRRNSGILIGLLVMVIIVSLISDNFLKTSNILNVFRQISTNAFLAFGMTFVILTGGIDLSVGSVLAFSGVFTAYALANWQLPLWVVIGVALFLSVAVGIFNGAVSAITGIAPFVVTLSTQMIFQGVAKLISNGMPIRVTEQTLVQIGTGYVGPIALPIIYTIVIMFICFLLLNKTKFGRNVYAIGGNRMAAKFAGIKMIRTEVIVYAISGFLSGAAGIVLAGRLSAGSPNTGDGYELDAIAAVVLGGASFTGGVGTIGGTLLGVIVIGVLNNGLNMLNVSSFWQYVAKGIVIFLAVLADVIRKKNQEKKKIKIQLEKKG